MNGYVQLNVDILQLRSAWSRTWSLQVVMEWGTASLVAKWYSSWLLLRQQGPTPTECIYFGYHRKAHVVGWASMLAM